MLDELSFYVGFIESIPIKKTDSQSLTTNYFFILVTIALQIVVVRKIFMKNPLKNSTIWRYATK